MNSRNFKIGFLIITFGILFTSCTTTRFASLNNSDKDSQNIKVYTTQIPDKPYDEISYIQTDGSIFHTPQKLLNGLKQKGIELKADAIINVKYDFQAWYPIASGTAIKFK
jgi:cobalamin biosynthesis Co2+ chelatase CbiK